MVRQKTKSKDELRSSFFKGRLGPRLFGANWPVTFNKTLAGRISLSLIA